MAKSTSVPMVVQQHLDDAVAQRSTRSVLVRAPHVKLHLLQRLDERLAASLDGLTVAAEAGAALCDAGLATPGRGIVFAATVGAIESRDTKRLNSLLSLAEAVPDVCGGLLSAFGWVSPPLLRGITKSLLDSATSFHRGIGLAACSMHQVDPGAMLNAEIVGGNLRAIQIAAKLGRTASLEACLEGLFNDDPALRFASARSAWLLGDRQASMQALQALAAQPGSLQLNAMLNALKTLPPDQVHVLLKPLSQEPKCIRLLLRGVGAAGDPHYIPWLIKQMSDLKLRRLAGEAFSMITGLDLAYLDLDTPPPEGPVFGPNDDPADADVAMDEDDSLPWPDVEKISAWWQDNGSRFQPGTRYFVGEPPSVAHCISVLKTGFQRQRIAAAEYLCLLKPGTPLFNVAAPAWRQERLLAQMGA